MRRILSIDGGGIKGAVPAAFLAHIEEVSKKSLVDYFDLIAGTSTGGIIALGLGLGIPAKEILGFYETEGPKIFASKWWQKRWLGRIISPKYKAPSLHESLDRIFDSRLLGDSKTRLVIPAYNVETRAVHVYKTAHHERFKCDWREKVIDVAMATAAAPTYFPVYITADGLPLVDGGLWANNPVGVAAVEAVGVLGWERHEIHILSLGCTDEVGSLPVKSGIIHGHFISEAFFAAQSHGAIGMAQLLTGHSESNPKIFRYNKPVEKGKYGLDSIAKIQSLIGLGKSEARIACPTIEKWFLQSPCEKFSPHYSEGPR